MLQLLLLAAVDALMVISVSAPAKLSIGSHGARQLAERLQQRLRRGGVVQVPHRAGQRHVRRLLLELLQLVLHMHLQMLTTV